MANSEATRTIKNISPAQIFTKKSQNKKAKITTTKDTAIIAAKNLKKYIIL